MNKTTVDIGNCLCKNSLKTQQNCLKFQYIILKADTKLLYVMMHTVPLFTFGLEKNNVQKYRALKCITYQDV